MKQPSKETSRQPRSRSQRAASTSEGSAGSSAKVGATARGTSHRGNIGSSGGITTAARRSSLSSPAIRISNSKSGESVHTTQTQGRNKRPHSRGSTTIIHNNNNDSSSNNNYADNGITRNIDTSNAEDKKQESWVMLSEIQTQQRLRSVDRAVPKTTTSILKPVSISMEIEQEQKQQNEEQEKEFQPTSDLSTIHGLLSSIGKELNIPSSTTAATNNNANNYFEDNTLNHNTMKRSTKNSSKSKIEYNATNDVLDTSKSNILGIPYNSIIILTTNTFSVTANTDNDNDKNYSNINALSKLSINDGKENQIHTKGKTKIQTEVKTKSTMEAHLSGRKLSLANEHLIIIPASSSNHQTNNDNNDNMNSVSDKQYLRYNDTVVLFNTNNKALGVNMNKNEKIGFWRSVIGEAEQWTIIPLFQSRNNYDHNYNHNSGNERCSNSIVKSGSKILLKNELNGKFLSFQMPEENDDENNNNTLQPDLVLQGLSWNDIQDIDNSDDEDNTNDNENGIEFDIKIRRNKPIMKTKTVQYTKSQVFNFVKINTPPCPAWLHTRPYLNGNFLCHPDRNYVDERKNLFLDDQNMTRNTGTRIHGMNTNASSSLNKTPLWKLDVSIQDSILVEEVLDVLIGLEGNYIVVSNNDDYRDSNHRYLDKMQFLLHDRSEFNPNIRYIVEKMLPTASEFVRINSFISKRLVEYEYGTVSHALCGAMDILVKEYIDFVESLHDKYRQESSSSITLSALYGELQASIRTISIIHRIVQEVKYCKGGALLNKIEDLLQMEYLGDQRAKSIFRYLFERSSIPYMEMLSGWVEDGSLNDPYEEFMIEQKRRDITPLALAGIDPMEEDSLSWKNWYVLRDEHVLNVLRPHQNEFLSNDQSELAQKILTTGKYWNAISLCHHRDKRAVQLVPQSPRGVESNRVEAPTLTYGMVSVDMARYIDHEYSMASKTFINIVMRDYQTIEILAFMKRYFLLDQGDFFVHFLDMAEDELLQEMTEVSRGRVHNWMALSIQMSGGAGSTDNDTESAIFDFVSSLKGEFATQSLINDLDELHALDGGIKSHEPKTPSRHMYGGANKGLTGVEAFMLDFHQMPFPLSLILSRSTVRNYQLMFRHLFFAKHVERRLVGTWLDHQMIKEYTSLRKDLGKTYCLRQRMLHFMQNFVYYMMFEVIEPNFLRMESHILGRKLKGEDTFGFSTNENAVNNQNVDDVLRIHNDFVQNTLKECLLTNRDLIRTLTKLMTTCLLFSDQMKLFMEATKIDEEQSSIATEARQKRTRHMYETAGVLNERKEKKIREALMALNQQRRLRKQKQINMLRRELQTESYQNMISRFEQVFNSNLSEFMTQLMADSEGRYHNHLSNLCIRLDYNGFVTRSMEK